jgi:K+-transporting ATPase ATPase C chain
MSHIRPAAVLLALFTALTGLVYPAAVTGVAQFLFPHQANGSLIVRDGRVVGSELIGQPFERPAYFWSRPSATTPVPYNAASSAASNLGPTNPALAEAVAQRVAALRAADPAERGPVPVDLVTASGSGLDPHISPAAAAYQVARVARARGRTPDEVRAIVARCTDGRLLGVMGEARVNVLRLNLALDAAFGAPAANR